MSAEPGGRAGKFGIRYEYLWVAKQLLRLIDEDIKSVIVEAIGDDERGVDLWVETKEGIWQAHQCKSRNGNHDRWTISTLKRRGIFDTLEFQLSRDPKNQFFFVSGVSSITLTDICISARNSNYKPRDFYEHQIKAIGQERRVVFTEFCRSLSLDEKDETHLNQAFDFLRRTWIELFPYTENTLNELMAKAKSLLIGNPKTILSLLQTYVENNDRLGNSIYADELLRFLESQEIYPRKLRQDRRLEPALKNARKRFEQSIAPKLIDNCLIPRSETDECLSHVDENEMIILHGQAGSGKSTVLYEITSRLQKKGIPWLPIRLDTYVPESSEQFARILDLPEPPVDCLVEFASNRPCVFILDQLDAIRWTSKHSTQALAVCKEMIRQIKLYKKIGKKISVILSCRTFDLDFDQEIKNWLDNEDWKKVEVKYLPEDKVGEVVGSSYCVLNDKQKNILANPQNLQMWTDINDIDQMLTFKSSTELMELFWKSKRDKMESSGVNIAEINNIIDVLIDKVQHSGRISVPIRVLNRCSPKAVDAFCSYGIIQKQSGKISFCHQSYLDFQIADRLVTDIESGGSILEWLGTKETQTLFRREQLRQALVLMSKEESDFINILDQILFSESVRFHLKHLALEVVSQIKEIYFIFDYFINLIDDQYWKDHVLETIFYGNVLFIRKLIGVGKMNEWLESGEEASVGLALWLLGSVIHKNSDEVVILLKLLLERRKEEWAIRILNTIGWRVVDDSDSIFELRLILARSKVNLEYYDWKAICKKFSLRALKLMEAILSTCKTQDDLEKSGLKNWNTDCLETFSKEFEDNSLQHEVWNSLFSHFVRLCNSDLELNEHIWPGRDLNRNELKISYILQRIATLLRETGQKLVEKFPDTILKFTKPNDRHSSLLVQRVLCEIYTFLPDIYSDSVIKWLLDDFARFHLGKGTHEPEWMPAVRLINKHSSNCSPLVFNQLETSIITYHTPDEKELAEFYLSYYRREHGYYKNAYWGETQYFLLPALAPNRISQQASDLITVLKRRFKEHSHSDFTPSGISGGFIGSKLDSNLEKIRDKSWVKIIKNGDVLEHDSRRSRQMGPDYAVESSVRQFSRSLRRIAISNPERFGKLMLNFPKNTHHFYISAIFEALALTKPNSEVLDDHRSQWQPAKFETILEVLKKFEVNESSESQLAKSFCRLVSSRAKANWPKFVIDQIIDLAINHMDLEIGKLNYSCDESVDDASIDTLYQNTFNCVRGTATEAIASLIWENPEMFDQFNSSVEALIDDQHPVVRMASIPCLLSLLNIDRDLAVEWFCRAVRDDLRVAASARAIEFINYNIDLYHKQLVPIIQRMYISEHGEISNMGSQMVLAYNLFYNLFVYEVDKCRLGTIQQQRGLVEIAVHNINNSLYAEKCRALVNKFINDTDEEINRHISWMFLQDDFSVEKNISAIKKYIKSAKFRNNPYDLFRLLKNHQDSLTSFSEVVLDACDEIVDMYLKETKTRRPYISYAKEVSTLLLRLYEQSYERNKPIALRCLDIWDFFFEYRIGSTRELARKIEV